MEKTLILCDSDVIINWLKNDSLTVKSLKEIGLDKICISSVSFMELIMGYRNKNELKQLKQRLKNYQVCHYNEDASKLAMRYLSDYYLSNNLEIPDAIIGASAVVFNIPLFTYNVKDFKFMPGIKLFDIRETKA